MNILQKLIVRYRWSRIEASAKTHPGVLDTRRTSRPSTFYLEKRAIDNICVLREAKRDK